MSKTAVTALAVVLVVLGLALSACGAASNGQQQARHLWYERGYQIGNGTPAEENYALPVNYGTTPTQYCASQIGPGGPRSVVTNTQSQRVYGYVAPKSPGI